MRDLQHKILLILVAITIIAEVASIILWVVNPTIPLGKARITLAVDFRIAVANAVVFAALNLMAFLWIVRRNKIGPLFLIAISIINRVISHPIFIGGAHIVFITWTVLLVIFAYLDYRKISKQR
jgi:magnesium-transporting ATPase (P-type)